MRRIALTIITAVALTGCSGASLTVPEAGEFYLDGVCPVNFANDDLALEVNRAYILDEPMNMKAVNEKAATARDAYRSVIEKFSADTAAWPEVVDADVDVVVDNWYTDVSITNQMAEISDQASFETLWSVWTDPASQVNTSGTPQKIRAKLGLSPDLSTSCEGR
ncbi:hypothetical protein [Arthrobacter burdickii]|uniref:Lipoprotein n=1 Tax=Arthrobacter burdickii TaxID=3035920 RepID=A0ABT8K234_9MICC|nr:hypothetical protein [Arthrobacter burdickii]MDN4611480.1 hypothetical protein [Arthrobacter burdickii]